MPRGFVIALFRTQENILELNHAGVGKQQRGIVGRNQRAGRHFLVSVGGKIVEKIRSDLVS